VKESVAMPAAAAAADSTADNHVDNTESSTKPLDRRKPETRVTAAIDEKYAPLLVTFTCVCYFT